MFCPKCRTEYREGFYTCADCSIPLVLELPTVLENSAPKIEIEFFEVLSTRNPAQLAFIKSIFEADNIVYYVLGEQMMTSPMLSGGAAARLFVAKPDIEKSKQILTDLELEEPDLLLDIFRKF